MNGLAKNIATLVVFFSVCFFAHSCGHEESSRAPGGNSSGGVTPKKQDLDKQGREPETPIVSASPPPQPAEKNFSFTYPGVPGTVAARLEDGWKIVLLPYPKEFTFKLKTVAHLSRIKIDDAFCNDVSAKLADYESLSESSKISRKGEIRDRFINVAFFEMLFLPTADGLFRGAAMQAAFAAFPGTNFADFENRVTFLPRNTKVKIVADPDALVNKIGEVGFLEWKLLPEFMQMSHSLGNVWGIIHAYDLLCDIYHNKAKIIYTVETSQGFSVTSTSTGLE